MGEAFIAILFGHVVGDFFLQPRWMAMNKGATTHVCLLHCLVYTLVVCCFTRWGWLWAGWVFVSHFPIDRWSLADKWLDLIGGRSLHWFYEDGMRDVKGVETMTNAQKMNYWVLRGGFTSVVYTVVDNFAHLILMFYGYRLIYHL